MHSIKDILLENKKGYKFFIPSTDDHFLFAKLLNALTNSESGGIIFIGINQKNKITGVFPKSEFEAIKNINKHFFINDIHFLTETLEIDNKLIIKLSVDSSLIKPQYVKNKEKKEVYIVHDGEAIKANHIIAKTLKYKTLNGTPPIELSLYELDIKNKIELNTNISLNNLYKICSQPKKIIDYVLVRLLNWNHITFKILDGSCYFKAN